MKAALENIMFKLITFLIGVILLSCQTDNNRGNFSMDDSNLKISPDVEKRLRKYAPVDVRADISFLPESEKKALYKLIDAAKYMDKIFLHQVSSRNEALRKELKNRQDDLGKKAFELFQISFGPWDRLNEEPFIGQMEKPEGAAYYPTDITKGEFEAYVKEHPEQEDSLKNLFTLVRREDNKLVTIPYSTVFAHWLTPAAKLMREAAELTENTSLKTFLLGRAQAFSDDEYRDSDMAWMDLDGLIEVVIGPYEVYEDQLFGYKAAFEAFVTVTDPQESSKLAGYKTQLPAMEENLPIPDEYKNHHRGTESPIRVVDVVFTAGDTKAGVQTIAFNLPNDEYVREKKGSKKVLLRNVIAAKYEMILKPIANRLIDKEQGAYLSANAFTNEVLFHELSHGLGPGKIVLNGQETEVRLALSDLYTPIEEAKADIMGVYNVYFMLEKKLLPESMRKEIAVTYLAGLFRAIRFGINEAHGKGNALQLNYLLEQGALAYDQHTEIYSVNFNNFEKFVRELLRKICILQATGDYDGTKELFEQYGNISEELTAALARLNDIPVDIVPRYSLTGVTE